MSRVKHSASFDLNQPTARLFPLFSAEGEKLWVPGWVYENVMGTTELSEDYVFLTKSHDHASAPAVWIVKRYEPDNHYIQFYKVEPGVKLGIITIKCDPLPADSTRTTVDYEYIGLSDEGNRFVEQFSWERYEAFIKEWQQLLVAYFLNT